jgi:hypothetical protein
MAADTPDAAFRKLRADWKAAVMQKTKELRDQYSQRLKVLETQAVERGDYAAAALLRKERVKFGNEPALPEISHGSLPGAAEKGQPVSLEMAHARLGGGVNYTSETGVLTGWAVTGASAGWLLPSGLEGGGYEVELTYASAPDAGGTLLLKEEFYTLRRTLEATAGAADFQTKIIGTLRLIPGSRLLELSAEAVKGSGLLELKSVRLIPAGEKK